MPVDGFSTGRDVTLTLVTPEAGVVTIDGITGFHKKQIVDTQSPVLIDAEVRHAQFYKGWSGGFDIERRSSITDDLFALLEANYWAGKNAKRSSITELIQEATGNITQWRYTGVVLTYDDAGAFRGDATVKQSIAFLASKRLKIA